MHHFVKGVVLGAVALIGAAIFAAVKNPSKKSGFRLSKDTLGVRDAYEGPGATATAGILPRGQVFGDQVLAFDQIASEQI